jgi:lysophospholipase L1-like esterase
VSIILGAEALGILLQRRRLLGLLLGGLLLVGHSARAAEAPKIKVALAGDSTVTDNAGWGKAFAELLGPNAECTNFAAGGRSSKSFYDEGRWKKVLALKPDYVFIQFGHNDQPGKGPQRETDPATTFRDNLRRYVDEARAAGAKPILVTSLCRRIFREGKIDRQQQPYADGAKAVAAEMKVPLVDLYALSVELAERLGPEKSKPFGPPHPQIAGAIDGTHLSAEGAKQIAALVAKATVDVVPELREQLPSVAK